MIKIWFDFGNDFLCTDDEASQALHDGHLDKSFEQQNAGRCAWLTELVEAKPHSCAELSQVTIHERIARTEIFDTVYLSGRFQKNLKLIGARNGVKISGSLPTGPIEHEDEDEEEDEEGDEEVGEEGHR